MCKYRMVYWLACHHTTKDAIFCPAAEVRNYSLCAGWDHGGRECQSVTGAGEVFVPVLPGWCEVCLDKRGLGGGGGG